MRLVTIPPWRAGQAMCSVVISSLTDDFSAAFWQPLSLVRAEGEIYTAHDDIEHEIIDAVSEVCGET